MRNRSEVTQAISTRIPALGTESTNWAQLWGYVGQARDDVMGGQAAEPSGGHHSSQAISFLSGEFKSYLQAVIISIPAHL